jgi:hypothetical protein
VKNKLEIGPKCTHRKTPPKCPTPHSDFFSSGTPVGTTFLLLPLDLSKCQPVLQFFFLLMLLPIILLYGALPGSGTRLPYCMCFLDALLGGSSAGPGFWDRCVSLQSNQIQIKPARPIRDPNSGLPPPPHLPLYPRGISFKFGHGTSYSLLIWFPLYRYMRLW